jgi:hypothetical protein
MNVERPKQELPAQIVADLMGAIRGAFYGDLPAKCWYVDQHFIRRNVVAWPASWLIGKGVTLPPQRYKEIVMGVLTTIKQHGNTGEVKYWPRYLMHCLQMHFKIHGDEIYGEGKAMRTRVENVMLAAKAGAAKPPVDPIEVIAAARRIKAQGRPPTTKRKAKEQLSLL